jgi:integrase
MTQMNPEIQTSEPVTTPQPAPKPKRRGFRLFKRDAAGHELSPEADGWRERDYHFRFQYRGKTYARCLETNDATIAQKYARAKATEIKDGAVRGELNRIERTKLRATHCGTVLELTTAYLAAPGDANPTTRNQNINALHQLLRTVHGAEADVEALPVREINAALAHAWFAAANLRAAAADSQADQASAKKTANSRFVQAGSLFTDRARACYNTKTLDHPNFDDFLRVGRLQRFTRLPRDQYNPPADHIIKATLEAWHTIEDRNLFLAIGHELAFGLRKGEIAQARWTWWTTREGYPVLDGVADVKNGSGLVQVRALDPWFSAMRARVDTKSWRGKPDDHIITGNNTFRTDDIFRAVSEWLRDLKWETTKTNHALRAYAGSQVAMRYGIYDAQCWLRHSTVKVTEQHYTHFMKKFRPADPDTIPARWATTCHDTPPLRILDHSA